MPTPQKTSSTRAGSTLGVALEQLVDDEGAHLLRAQLGQRALEGTADRRADGVDDYCFGHAGHLLRAGVVKCGPQGSGSRAQGSAAGSKLTAMSLDGLRAWIGLVERKLTMRTRVFLVLVAIAIGGAGAAIVLASRRPEQRRDQE